jgi:sterol desaturase/sphingolipid hydroxylase (fatty acid hydroxylase superfamily)
VEAYANALLFAIPGFMVLILIEALYGHFRKNQTFRGMDTISSLSSGITNVIKDSLGLIVALITYPFLLNLLALQNLEATWPVYVIGFIAIDFAGYWSHRLNHSVNVFWNRHIVHHSSEEFNLACALRQSVSNILGFYAVFLIPAALIGVPEQVIALLAPLHLFAQFWCHTRHIPKMGWLEYIIITPSQHRVHHAINPEYLDKNLGQIFSIWDRMFGTFQEELDDVPPVYGVTRPVSTWNPIKINFQHLWLLAKDAWRTQSLQDKARVWFMPTGWRPPDVAEQYPVKKIEDVYQFDRYSSSDSRLLLVWSWFQLISVTLLLLFMLSQFGNISREGLLLYGGILFLSIYGFTSLMDLERSAPWVELARGLIGLGIVYYTGGWFGVHLVLPGGSIVVASYFLITILGSIYFHQTEVLSRQHDNRMQGAVSK